MKCSTGYCSPSHIISSIDILQQSTPFKKNVVRKNTENWKNKGIAQPKGRKKKIN